MLKAVFIEHVWTAIVFVSALSILDYRLSITGLRWYRRGANVHYDFGGSYELNPPFERDVEELRSFSPRHLMTVARTAALIGLVWWFTAHAGRWEGVYVGVLGFFILIQAPVQIRHLHNLAMFRYVALRGGVEGRVESERWLDMRLSGVLFWLFGAVYLVFYAIVDDAFFLGGVVGCLLVGSRFWILADESE